MSIYNCKGVPRTGVTCAYFRDDKGERSCWLPKPEECRHSDEYAEVQEQLTEATVKLWLRAKGMIAVPERDAEIVETVFKFIDRMNDHCETDPAEKILDEFVKAITPTRERV